MAITAQTEALLLAWNQSTLPVESRIPNLRRHGQTTIVLVTEYNDGSPLSDNQVMLNSIFVPVEHRMQGHMYASLKEITRLADRFGVSVILDAVPEDDKSPSGYDLKQIYKSLGFYNAGGYTMRRDPAQP